MSLADIKKEFEEMDKKHAEVMKRVGQMKKEGEQQGKDFEIFMGVMGRLIADTDAEYAQESDAFNRKLKEGEEKVATQEAEWNKEGGSK